MPEADAIMPSTIEDVSAALRHAAEAGRPVLPVGGGTKLAWGNPAPPEALQISTRPLNGLLAHEPADLTCTAQAGMTLAELQQAVADHGQHLPLDPALPRQATLGGIAAANDSGPSRYRFGTMRDSLLGIRAVLSNGEVIQGGGQVVKNVAGYDLPKLFIGSLGTLGIIVEMSFKLQPLPAARGTVIGCFASHEQAEGSVAALMAGQLLPTFIEAVNAEFARLLSLPLPGGPIRLLIGFDGTPAEVEYQLEAARKLLGEQGGREVSTLSGATEVALREALRDRRAEVGSDAETAFVASTIVQSSVLLEFMQSAEGLLRRPGWAAALQAHAGNGIVHVLARMPSPSVAYHWTARDLVAELRALAQAHDGYLTLRSAPEELKRAADAWGRDGAEVEVMRRVKQALDPAQIMSPGRFVGGI